MPTPQNHPHENVKRWAAVLRKCPEVTEKSWVPLARLFENQFTAWEETGNGRIGQHINDYFVDFTRFIIPVTRYFMQQAEKRDIKVTVSPITDRTNPPMKGPVTLLAEINPHHILTFDINRHPDEHTIEFHDRLKDAKRSACGYIAGQLLDPLIEKYGQIIPLHLLIVPRPLEFEPRVDRFSEETIFELSQYARRIYYQPWLRRNNRKIVY